MGVWAADQVYWVSLETVRVSVHVSAHTLIVLSWSKERMNRDCCNVCVICIFVVYVRKETVEHLLLSVGEGHHHNHGFPVFLIFIGTKLLPQVTTSPRYIPSYGIPSRDTTNAII